MMKILDGFPTESQFLKLNALACWYKQLENHQMRMDSPDDYHDELTRQADEMDRLGIISWQEWRELRQEAHAAYLEAVAGADYPSHQRLIKVKG